VNHPTQGQGLVREMLGEDEMEEQMGDDKHRVYIRIESLAEELAEVTEERDRLRKGSSFWNCLRRFTKGKRRREMQGLQEQN